MTAHTPIADGKPLIDFDIACTRLNAWRGQMIENFARSEQAVTETLILFNTSGVEVKGDKFPHLVGQRYERLKTLLSAPESQTKHRKIALDAMVAFQAHDDVRTMLCHGVTKPAVDYVGEWIALMTLRSFKAKDTSTRKLTLLEREAVLLLEKVIEDRRRVACALGQVRGELRAPATAA